MLWPENSWQGNLAKARDPATDVSAGALNLNLGLDPYLCGGSSKGGVWFHLMVVPLNLGGFFQGFSAVLVFITRILLACCFVSAPLLVSARAEDGGGQDGGGQTNKQASKQTIKPTKIPEGKGVIPLGCKYQVDGLGFKHSFHNLVRTLLRNNATSWTWFAISGPTAKSLFVAFRQSSRPPPPPRADRK